MTLEFRSGEVHALVGENGAGKSTLIKILAGAIQPDSGRLLLDGQALGRLTPRSALEHGITAIYQEFNLIPSAHHSRERLLRPGIGEGRIAG